MITVLISEYLNILILTVYVVCCRSAGINQKITDNETTRKETEIMLKAYLAALALAVSGSCLAQSNVGDVMK